MSGADRARDETSKLLLLAAVFVALLVAANVGASKLFVLGPFVFPGGFIAFSLTFLVTDVVAEVWGRRRARQFIWLGFLASILAALYFILVRFLPPAPFWPHQGAYEAILGVVPRITAASLVTYLVSQTHDVWAFEWWKRRTGGRHLWLRNNLSTMVSQLIDSTLFGVLAFAGVIPPAALINLILAQYVAKMLVAAADTPLVYLGVAWARGGLALERAGDRAPRSSDD